MSNIKLLPTNLINLIAAGEVIERPASVVKELVENSIDANSKKICVEVKFGGIKFINVSDDGNGIADNELKNAFLKHYTSKICNENDLFNIGTLGFRGEALASIAAVSRIQISTKHLNKNLGSKLQINAGKFDKIYETVRNRGTEIIVKDLFFNVPARLKFLKSFQSEGSYVTSIITKLALSHPEISFIYNKDKSEIFKTYGDDISSNTILNLFGKDILEKCEYVNYSLNNIEITGYIGLPSTAKTSRKKQFFFLNGRYVKIPAANNALDECFKHVTVREKKFVFCVLYIKIPEEIFDINVSPSKLDVRFQYENKLYEAIFFAIKSTIFAKLEKKCVNLGCSELELKENNKNKFENISKELENSKNFRNHLEEFEKIENIKRNQDFFKEKSKIEKNNVKKLEEIENIEKNNKNHSKIPENYLNSENYFKKNKNIENEGNIEKINSKIFDNIKKSLQSSFDLGQNMRLVGEIFKRYLLVEYVDELLVIDKHAAHEKIIFDTISKQENLRHSQCLMHPIVPEIDDSIINNILENLPIFEYLGFKIEDFNESLIVREIPLFSLDDNANICVLLTEISDGIRRHKISFYGNMFGNKDFEMVDAIHYLYSRVACKLAVKSGKISSIGQILSLIKSLLENPKATNCPHGRPIFIWLSLKYFNKFFCV